MRTFDRAVVAVALFLVGLGLGIEWQDEPTWRPVIACGLLGVLIWVSVSLWRLR